jgi:hypothetical protein
LSIPRFFFRKTRLRDVDVAGKVAFRQGLWIEDLRTPPGQECSNGSLILLAIVLWRTFFWPSPAVASLPMKLLKVQTARFAQVVDVCGEPETYTLWQKPAADRHFQSQIKNNRVMTIQKSESGTDFGIASFKQRKGATYLIFPKSLKRFADKRIVGIDWALIGQQ